MIYLKWFVLAILDLLLTLTVVVAAPIIALFTREQAYGKPEYTWGWLWGTYDNPPQGDEGYVAKRALFPNETTGIKGYVNRVMWMFRNPLYGFSRRCAINYSPKYRIVTTGNPDISDKYKVPGYMLSKLYYGNKLIGFEFYMVKPWSETKDLRVRLGWKLTTEKFALKGFAPLVVTANPFDGYGND